jgi:5-methylcytosine-specific restriction endonuclease McrA
MSDLALTRHRAETMWLVELGDVVAVQRTHGRDRAAGGTDFRRLRYEDGRPEHLDPLPPATGRAVRELWKAGQIRTSRAGWPHGRLHVRTMLTTAAGRRWVAGVVPKTHRGTTNGNSRGGSAARRRRKQWLLDQFGDGTTAPCSLKLAGCAEVVTIDTISVDRILPGCQGGTYRRTNIQPACGSCNSKHGAQLGHARR